MKVFVPTECRPAERRVAATPETVEKMAARGWTVSVEAGAGDRAGFADSAYSEAGAELAETTGTWPEADVVAKVAPLAGAELAEPAEADRLRSGTVVLGLLDPYTERQTMDRLAERGVTAVALELLPRVTRAQTMDALSSQASIAGYRAVVLAASRLDRYFPLLMTAAGTISPARVVIMGAGVAGLQAVATAKRLGAVVEVSDIRPVVREQVESLGGRFIDLPLPDEGGAGAGGYAKEMTADFLKRQREILSHHVAAADVVITTALVPGKRPPMLIDRDMFGVMKPGAIIVDLAAPQGGNCELTQPGEDVEIDGVTILGPLNLPASMAHDASTLYSRNILALLEHLTSGDDQPALTIDREDEITAGSLVTHGGEIVHPALAAKADEEKVS